MTGKLSRLGDEWVLVLGPDVMERWQIDVQTELELTTDGTSLVVTPVTDCTRRQRFEAALDECNERYGAALERLAGGAE
jgi:hypothetical protein